MRIFIDGVIFSLQKKGGISRIFAEVLSPMCALDSALDITLLAQDCDRHILPQHDRIHVVPGEDWSQSRLFNKGIIKKLLVKIQRFFYLSNFFLDTSAIWYSSYYTLPSRWQGPAVMLAADLIHELYPNSFVGVKNDDFRERKRRCITRADAVICISETTRKDLIAFYKIDPQKTHVALLAHNTVFRPLGQDIYRYKRVTERPFLLYIGTRVHYKNYDLFIKTYAQWAYVKEVDVVFVGPELSIEEQHVLDVLGIAGRVHVLKGVDDERLCVLYNQALAFIYPSIYEGFGVPLLEAMACGCPVVASDIPSTREIAADVPYYFRFHDQRDLIRSLEEVWQREGVDERITRGMERCRNYSWQKTAQQTLGIFSIVLKNGRAVEFV